MNPSPPSPVASSEEPKRRPRQRLGLFALWLMVFYAAWATTVLAGGHWETVRSHWPIGLAMALGSYFAGSTPMGGGTVGFPVLVLLFEMPGSMGRNFGLAVQSIGMVSASVFILCARRPLAWNVLRPALAGAVVGTVLGAAMVAPFVPDLWIKLIFAVTWASFGILHLVKLREIVGFSGSGRALGSWDRPAGLAIGLLGGLVASVTGVGIDMVLYAVLVLLYRADLKVSIPTSVVLMAFTSLIGLAANVLLSRLHPGLYHFDPEVFANWLAAAPVVAVGAPFGVLMVHRIPRAPTLLLVSVLCLGQFVWTLIHEQVWGWALGATIAALLAMNAGFHALYRWGEGETARRHAAASPSADPAA